jgi:hypothetical protein
MASSKPDLEIWLQEHQEAMIYCPYHKGDLIISKRACIKRFRASQRSRRHLAGNNGYPSMLTIEKRLALCERCHIARKLVLPMMQGSSRGG